MEHKITIIIPCYNEKNTIVQILNKIENINDIKKQIIVVDDNSTDNSEKLISEYKFKSENKIIYHKKNLGKGSCIISAKKFITGDIVIIQDADLEYDPTDYKKLIKPIINKTVNVVYGSRVLGKKRYISNKFTSLIRVFANHVLTTFSNFINNQNLTDAHTCYKVFNTEVFQKINFVEKGFSICPEMTTKLAILGEIIQEVEISYKGRSYKEGKKISLYDGFDAILTILKYRFK